MGARQVEVAVEYRGIKFGAVAEVSSLPGRVCVSTRLGMRETTVTVPVESAEAFLAALGDEIREAKNKEAALGQGGLSV